MPGPTEGIRRAAHTHSEIVGTLLLSQEHSRNLPPTPLEGTLSAGTRHRLPKCRYPKLHVTRPRLLHTDSPTREITPRQRSGTRRPAL